jgi:hypothetical protein
MFEKLYLVDANDLERIQDRPPLSYLEIYDSIVKSKKEQEEETRKKKKIPVKNWLRYEWKHT